MGLVIRMRASALKRNIRRRSKTNESAPRKRGGFFEPPSDEGGGFCEAKDGGREQYLSPSLAALSSPLVRGGLCPWSNPRGFFFAKSFLSDAKCDILYLRGEENVL